MSRLYYVVGALALSLAVTSEVVQGFSNGIVSSQFVTKSKRLSRMAPSDFTVSDSPEVVAMNTSPIPVNPGLVPPYTLSTQQFTYVILTSIFVTCLIIADVIGVKLFEFKLPFEILGHKSIEHTCGMITFPITFLLGDTINEYYGAKATRQTVYIGLFMSILVFGVINLAQVLPYLDKPFNVSKEAFDTIFGSAKLMYVASIIAYLIGQLSDIWLFGIIKQLTKGKLLWLRATGSTVISQMLDSFVVSYVAFSLGKTITGQIPASLPEIFNIAVTGYALKFALSLVITPLLYAMRYFMHNKVGLEPLPIDYVEPNSGAGEDRSFF